MASSNILIHVPSLFFVSFFKYPFDGYSKAHHRIYHPVCTETGIFLPVHFHASSCIRIPQKVGNQNERPRFPKFCRRKLCNIQSNLTVSSLSSFDSSKNDYFFTLARNLSVFSENLLSNSLALELKKKKKIRFTCDFIVARY